MRKIYLELEINMEEWFDYVDSPDEIIIDDSGIPESVKSGIGIRIIENPQNKKSSDISLAETVIKVLDKKARAGCIKNSSWVGHQNCNGTEIGVDIERLINQAKRFLKKNN